MGDNLFEGLPPPSQQKSQQQEEDKKQQQQQQQQRHNTTTSSSSSSFSSPVPPPIPVLKSALKRPKPTEPFPEPEGYYSFFPHFVVWNCFAFCFQTQFWGV